MKFSSKWAAAFVAPAVVAGGSLVMALPAAAVDLPDVTPKELLMLMDGDVTGFSGTVTKTSDIGLPVMELSSMMSQDAVDDMAEKMPEGFEDFVPQLIEQNSITQLVELGAGTHTMRVYASESGSRVQILDQMSQRDLIVTPTEFWIYDAGQASAVTGTLGSGTKDSLEVAALRAQELAASPEEMIDALLEEVGASSDLSVGQDHRIAGRTAYQLVVEPRSAVSLIESVVVSVDSETGMALGVEVFARSSSAVALEIGFDSIRFETPDADLFSFTPPPGTTVEVWEAPQELTDLADTYADQEPTEQTLRALADDLQALSGSEDLPASSVVGEDWEAVMVTDSLPADFPTELLETELFADLMVEVDGGTAFSTPILNILLADSGKVYAGAVTLDHLVKVAAE